MSESKHTPGELDIHNAGGHLWIIRAGERLIAGNDIVFVLDPRPLYHENAAHMVACWNACDGINPKAVPGLLAACKRLARGINAGHLRLSDIDRSDDSAHSVEVGIFAAIVTAEGAK